MLINYFVLTLAFLNFVNQKLCQHTSEQVYMKKIFLATLFTFICGFFLGAQTKTHFEYPMAPDSIETLQGRTSYILLRFWDKADMKKLLNDTTKFNEAFADYVSFIPYASADSVKKSINNLLSQFKNDPKSTMKIVKAAEKNLFGPEARFWADEQYLLFTKAALTNKKVSSKDKEYFLRQVKMLNSSQTGATIAPISYTTRHGAVHNLYDQPGEYTLVYVHGPGCDDCGMTSLRMEADVAINALTKNGTLKIIDIYTGNPDDTWKKSVEGFPFEWEAGTSDNIGDILDVRNLPVMYLLDKDKKIMSRDINIDSLLSVAMAIYQKQMK